ncbi:MAG: hypothetical protein MUP17_07335 [candidate division Zixibacteria bacterium]|nr:hypothetical protein [candidate division Zixibacteria bacterium]
MIVNKIEDFYDYLRANRQIKVICYKQIIIKGQLELVSILKIPKKPTPIETKLKQGTGGVASPPPHSLLDYIALREPAINFSE